MAVFVLKNCFVKLNAVDLSDHVRSVTLNYEAADLDTTAMSDNSQNRIAGLKDWSAEIEFNQDHAAASVDATLFSLVGAAAFAVEFRSDAGAVAATNPKYTGNAILTSYPPIGGSVGDVSTAKVTVMGDGDLTRATA